MRRASVLLAIASIVIPAALVFLSIVEAGQEVRAHGGPICGLPFLADFILASLLCSVLSASAFVLGTIAYRRVSSPRPKRRLVELTALLLPLIIVGGYAATLLLAL
jgi:hypothetical protein